MSGPPVETERQTAGFSRNDYARRGGRKNDCTGTDGEPRARPGRGVVVAGRLVNRVCGSAETMCEQQQKQSSRCVWSEESSSVCEARIDAADDAAGMDDLFSRQSDGKVMSTAAITRMSTATARTTKRQRWRSRFCDACDMSVCGGRFYSNNSPVKRPGRCAYSIGRGKRLIRCAPDSRGRSLPASTRSRASGGFRRLDRAV